MKRIVAALLLCVAASAHGGPVVAFFDPGGEASDRAFAKVGRLFDERVRPRFPDAVIQRRTLRSDTMETARAEVSGALAMRPDVVMTADAYMARAVSEYGGVPLVFLTLAEPVSMGIVDDPIAPRRNVTGYTLHVPFELKHIELLRECLPGLKRVGVLADPDWGREPVPQAMLRDSPRLFGVTVELFNATTAEAMVGAISGARAIDAWYVPDTSPNRQYAARIGEALRAARKPSIGAHGSHVANGGLMAYAPEPVDPWPRAVEMLAMVLSGIPAREIPIERPRRFQLVVSASAVRALGLDMPRSLLLKVDELAR